MIQPRILTPLCLALTACPSSTTTSDGPRPVSSTPSASDAGPPSGGGGGGAPEYGEVASGGKTSEPPDGGETTLCAPWSHEYQPMARRPAVMLVLDKSGSMMAHWDHDEDPSTEPTRRWSSLHAAVDFVLGRFEETIDFGALLFPATGSAVDCQVANLPDVPVGRDQRVTILQRIPESDATFFGGTPARRGVENAAHALESVELGRPRAIVLVTDGAANCHPDSSGTDQFELPDDGLAEVVGDLRTLHGITTHVIGIDIIDELGSSPTVNAHEQLSAIAIAGGAPQPGDESFYNASSEAQLTLALEQVGSGIECSFTLPEPAANPELVAVHVGGYPEPEIVDCSTQRGWMFAGSGPPFDTLMLCGEACSGEPVYVALGCP